MHTMEATDRSSAGRFEPGQWVVVRGKTLGRIQGVVGDLIVIEEADLGKDEASTIEIPTSRAADSLRSMVTADEARALLDHLCDDRPGAHAGSVSERSIAYRRAHKGGDLRHQVDTLAGIYRHPAADYPERQYRDILETTVFAELAHALGRSRKSVKAVVRAAVLGERPPVHLSLPDPTGLLAAHGDPPDLDGHEPLGAFVVDTSLAIGEAHAEVTTPAARGVWFAYVTGEMDSEEEPYTLVAIHHAAVTNLIALSKMAKQIGEAIAEGALMAIFDAALIEDDEFVDEVFATACGIVGQRGAVMGTGGDGSFPVFAAFDGGDSTSEWGCGSIEGERAVYVRVVL
jgi:hypothetical protein